MANYGYHLEGSYTSEEVKEIVDLFESYLSETVEDLYGEDEEQEIRRVLNRDEEDGEIVYKEIDLITEIPTNGYNLKDLLGEADDIWPDAINEGIEDYWIVYNGIGFPISGYLSIGNEEEAEEIIQEGLEENDFQETPCVPKIVRKNNN